MGDLTVLSTPVSCGIREVYGIYPWTTPEQFLTDIYDKTNQMAFSHRFAFVMFSHKEAWAEKTEVIVKYIEDMGLGSVMKSNKVQNPNSGNLIQVFLWEIKWDAFDAWYKNPTKKPTALERTWIRMTTTD